MTHNEAMPSVSEQWASSSYSGQQGNCVEWRRGPGAGRIEVRDSKYPSGSIVAIDADAWTAVVGLVCAQATEGGNATS